MDVLAAVNAATASAPQSTALELSPAGSNIVAGVAFYGTRIDREALARVRKPLALYFASEDPLVPLSDVEDFRKVLEARVEDSAVATSTGLSPATAHRQRTIFKCIEHFMYNHSRFMYAFY